MKLKKGKKSKRQSRTHGYGSRKKHRGKGSKGGKGMAGTGKKAGQKKTKIEMLQYFGKQGITSRGTARDKEKVINLRDIEKNLKKEKNNEINLQDYKILGEGEVKEKLIIKARAASKSAREKVEKAGGKIIVEEKVKKSEKIKKIEEKLK